MKSYYSIISASIRPQIDEWLSIGLCLIGQNEVFIDFSKQKISIACQLITTSRFSGLNASINDVLNTEKTNKSAFTRSQLNLLSQKNNNILLFTKPAIIDLPNNKITFDILFRKYVNVTYPNNSIKVIAMSKG